MDRGLRVEVIYGDADLHELRVRVWNGEFGGTTQLYVAIGELATSATVIQGFPTNLQDERHLQWGNFGSDSAGGAISLHFRCGGSQGHVVVDVTIESDPDRSDSLGHATLSLHPETAAIDRFTTELAALERVGSGMAMLDDRAQ